jgi:hypothetical protein
MKTFATDGRVPLGVILPADASTDAAAEAHPAPASIPVPVNACAAPTSPTTTPHPADIETADTAEALSAYPRPRTVALPGREPLDLESISDLWLD